MLLLAMRIFFPGCLLFLCGFFFLAAEDTDYYLALEGINDENAVLAFVRAELEKAGAQAGIKDFSDFTEGHSFSHILQTKIPGPSRETLIIAAPAVSGGSGFSAALCLSLWRESRRSPPPLNLLFLFLGGDGDRPMPAADDEELAREKSLGTRLFLESFFSQDPASVLYLGFTELPGRILCETGTRGLVAPSWMLENARLSLEDSGLAFLIGGNKNRFYRLGLARSASPAGEYLAAGFPALGLAGEGRAGNGDYAAWEKAFHAFFRSYLPRSADGLSREWDQHYLFFRYGPAYRIVGEGALVIVLVSVLGAGILYAFFARTRLKRYAKIFLRGMGSLPLILLILVLSFMAGTAIVRFTAVLRNTQELWSHSPLAFFILKTGCSVLLVLLVLPRFRRLPFSKNASFYSASAIFCFLALVLLSCAVDITFTPFFLWPCAASFFFSFFRRLVAKTTLFLAALLPFGLLAHDAFFLAEKGPSRILVDSALAGNLLLGIIFLPFLLMLIRVSLPGLHPRAARFARILKFFAGGVCLAALVFALAFNPWRGSAQPLSVEEYEAPAEALHELRLSSPSALGNFRLAFGGENFSVDTGSTSLTLPLGTPEERPSHTIRAKEFLGRKNHTILFAPALRPEKVTLTLNSGGPLLVYDCNFPYSLDITGRAAEVFIGRDPPLPLSLSLSFPAGQTVSVRITSWSPLLSGASELEGKAFARENYSKLVDSFIIKPDE